MAKIIGIDLGTTNSCVAVMEGGEPVTSPTLKGRAPRLRVVAFARRDERLVGQIAKRQAITNPDRTISSIKRQMGSNFKVDIDGKAYTPQEISAMVLQKLKQDAESYLGETVTQAVITVPPTSLTPSARPPRTPAASRAWKCCASSTSPLRPPWLMAWIRRNPTRSWCMTWAAAPLNVSLLEIGDGVFEVRGAGSNTKLGGDDFDDRIVDYVAEIFKKRTALT